MKCAFVRPTVSWSVPGSERTPVGSTVPNMTAGHVNDTQKTA